METEIPVPDLIILKGNMSERSIRLENCQNQNEVIDYLKICLSLFSSNYPQRIVADSEKSKRIQSDSFEICGEIANTYS